MNITVPIRRHALLAPGSIAIVHPRGAVSYGELERVINAVAIRVTRMGFKAGNVVGVLLGDRYGELVLSLALARIGVVSTPSVPVLRGLGGVSVMACFTDAGAKGDFPQRKIVVDDGWWQNLPATTPVPSVEVFGNDDSACRIVTSSGTTGVPKAIVLSHGLLTLRNFSRTQAILFPGDLRILCIAGLNSIFGFNNVLSAIWSGGFVVLSGNVAQAGRMIHAHQLNCVAASTAQLQALVGALPAGGATFPSLRLVVVGGSMLGVRLAQQVRERLCQNLYVNYGATEIGSAATAPVSLLESHANSVGVVLPDVTVQAVDDDLNPLPPGSQGVLRIRGDTCVNGYLGDREATAMAFKDGWFYPGDMGSVDVNGLLRIHGRVNELINCGGVKVSPLVIEEILLENKDVLDAAAFGVADQKTGQVEICAAIVQRGKVDTRALQALCMKRLGPTRMPKGYLLMTELPRNENGKVEREQLVRRMLAARSKGGAI